MLIKTWEGDLVSGTLLSRRHRFLLDVQLSTGETVVAHCANPGRMESLVRIGSEVWLSRNLDPKRSLSWTWELIRIDGELVGANSWAANILVKQLLQARAIPGLDSFDELRAEAIVSKGVRIDFELTGEGGKHLVEVKNGHLTYPDGNAYFPDSLTVRSVTHLRSLGRQLRKSSKATLLVSVQRSNAKMLRPSDFHDPAFAKALRTFVKKGLSVRALKFEPTTRGFIYRGELSVDLAPYDVDPVKFWHEQNKPFGGWLRPKGDLSAPWRRAKRRRVKKSLSAEN